jgi:hypothetical protein
MTCTKTTPDHLAADLALLREKQEELKDLDFVLRGTILAHYLSCGKPGCQCHADPPVLRGPYYDWTRKVGGKTVTVRLKEEEAKALLEWIANGRELDRIVEEMFQVTLHAVERMRGRAPNAEDIAR